MNGYKDHMITFNGYFPIILRHSLIVVHFLWDILKRKFSKMMFSLESFF
jgi:hypothetical protein